MFFCACVCTESIDDRHSGSSLKVSGRHPGAGQQQTTQPPDDALLPVLPCESEGF